MKDVPSFLGAQSIDTMIKPLTFPAYSIINFSKSYERGTHFVAILFINKKKCLYFDPLNLSFIPQEIIMYMLKFSKDAWKIEYRVQNPLSIFCGFYCLVPVLLHVNKISILRGLSIFEEGSLKNDELCIDLLSHLFKMYYLRKFRKWDEFASFWLYKTFKYLYQRSN